MMPGASTPEELESLLEDGFVVADRLALAELFEPGGVLCAENWTSEARGSAQIGLAAAALCACGYSYIGEPRRVLQAGDTALVVGERAISVTRRGPDHRWRYAISLLDIDKPTDRSQR
jgi:hypothetical protein